MIEKVQNNIFYVIVVPLLGKICLAMGHNRNGCNNLSGKILIRLISIFQG